MIAAVAHVQPLMGTASGGRTYHSDMVARVPTPTSPLLGRSDALQAVRDLVDSSRLVTITGPPGVGKTRLAVAVAHAVADRFADGAVWLDLAPVRDAQAALTDIVAAAAGVMAPAARRPRVVATDRHVLVVLDNCEHLLEAMAGLSGLLANSPRLHVLATSRERLHISGEREFPLPPLQMPSDAQVDHPDQLTANPAVALLLAAAPANVRLTAQTARALADICIRLDGLPLALELAAARLRVFAPAELAFRLERRMAVLTSGARDAPQRHQNLRSAVAWSHDLLPEPERAVFRQLSVLVGDWTIDAATAVCTGDAVPAIESLAEKSLVRRADTPEATGRFRMLASVREFAAEQLELNGEADDTAARHRAFFADAARHWESANGTAAETTAWQELGAVYADLRVALAGSRDAAATLWLAAGVGWYAYTRGVLAGCRGVPDAVHRAADEVDDWAAAVAGLTAAGIVSLGVRELDTAERDLHRAAILCEQHHDLRRLAIVSAFSGHLAREQGDLDNAAGHYGVARKIFERLGHLRGIAWSGHDLALVAFERGDLADAQALSRDALRLFRDLEYEWAIGVAACVLAGVLRGAGAIDEPTSLYGEALTLHVRLGDARGVAQCMEGLAELCVLRGAAATAARLRGAALAQRQVAGADPTGWEQTQLARLDAAIATALDPADADHQLQAGRTMPPDAALRLAAEAAAAPESSPSGTDAGLTARQLEVAALVAAGCTNRQIARGLGISEKTAEVHVRNIMERLRISGRAGIATWAVHHGLRPSQARPGGPAARTGFPV